MHSQETLYQSILNASTDGIFVHDKQNYIVYVNDAACKNLEYTREELLGMSVFDIDPLVTENDVRQLQAEQLERSSDHKFKLHFQSKHRTKSGRIFDVEINAWDFMFDSELYFISIVKDISQIKKEEHELAILKFAFDYNHDSSFLINESGRFLYVNEALCNVLGYSKEEMLLNRVSDVNPDFTQEEWPDHWQVIKEHGSMTFDSHNQTKSGEIFPVMVSQIPSFYKQFPRI